MITRSESVVRPKTFRVGACRQGSSRVTQAATTRQDPELGRQNLGTSSRPCPCSCTRSCSSKRVRENNNRLSLVHRAESGRPLIQARCGERHRCGMTVLSPTPCVVRIAKALRRAAVCQLDSAAHALHRQRSCDALLGHSALLTVVCYRSWPVRQGASVSANVSSIRLHQVIAALTASRACRGLSPTRSPFGPWPVP